MRLYHPGTLPTPSSVTEVRWENCCIGQYIGLARCPRLVEQYSNTALYNLLQQYSNTALYILQHSTLTLCSKTRSTPTYVVAHVVAPLHQTGRGQTDMTINVPVSYVTFEEKMWIAGGLVART